MLTPIAEPQQKRLVAAQPGAEFERLAPQLERVSLPLGEMLYEPGQQLQHAYFPTTAIGVLRRGAQRVAALAG